MEVKVTIEEVLSKTITFEVSDDLTEDERTEYVDEKIKEMYQNSKWKSILSADDFSGYVQIQYEDDEVTTDWYNLGLGLSILALFLCSDKNRKVVL